MNLLSPETVAKVGNALEKGILCGLHAFYCAGGGPEPCAFVDLNSYICAVEKSRPGDRFTLWSVPKLAELDVLLIRKQIAPVSEDELQSVKDWLNENPIREFVAAGYPAESAPPEVAWGDYDSFDQLQELAVRCAPAGEFAVLPLTNLLFDDLRRWAPKSHLVDAKRPNDCGEVPLGGAY
ncbi:MAG: hypothetical protein WBQ94_25575 [Terracidiphilus sp.]